MMTAVYVQELLQMQGELTFNQVHAAVMAFGSYLLDWLACPSGILNLLSAVD